MDKRLYNISLLGLSFLFLFAAYQTIGNIEETLLKSVQNDYPSFTGDGYTSLSISYFVFSMANWISPSIVNYTGCKIAMIIGAICYTFVLVSIILLFFKINICVDFKLLCMIILNLTIGLSMFLVSFLWLSSFLLYLMSAVQGFGAAILWTGQGTYLTLNSDPSTMSRNSGVFWALSNISMLLGNTFVFFALHDKNDFDERTRKFIYIVLIASSVFGTLIFLLLRSPVSPYGTENERVETISFIHQIKNTMSLFLTKEMRLLNITFFFTGLHLSFYAGVYSSSIGFTKRMGSNRKQLVGLSGILIGVGEILGGLIFSTLGQKTFDKNIDSKRLSHSAVILLGFIINIVAYGLIFINLPNDSPFGETTAKSFIDPNQHLAIFCSFLLGFGDSCFNTQLYNIIGLRYSENSAPPTALFNFMQSIAAALSFYYSNYFGIYVQLILLMVSLTMATLSFFKVDKSTDKRYYEEL